MIAALSIINMVGVKWGAGVQNVTTFAKLGALLLIVGLAAFAADKAEPVEVTEAVSKPEKATLLSAAFLVFAGLVPVLFSFGGWQQALWIGGEIRSPAKNVPRAIVLGVLTVVIVYLLSNWAYFQLLGYDGVAHANVLAGEAVSRVWPRWGKTLISAAVAVSAFGVLNAQLLSGPRLVVGMARDGKFFSLFGSIHARFNTPVAAILLLGGIGMFLLLIARSENDVFSILNGVVLIDSLFFMLTGLAVIVLRYRKPEMERSVRVPFYPWVPLLFAIGELAVMTGAFLYPKYREGAITAVIWILVAALAYACFFRNKKNGDSIKPSAESNPRA